MTKEGLITWLSPKFFMNRLLCLDLKTQHTYYAPFSRKKLTQSSEDRGISSIAPSQKNTHFGTKTTGIVQPSYLTLGMLPGCHTSPVMVATCPGPREHLDSLANRACGGKQSPLCKCSETRSWRHSLSAPGAPTVWEKTPFRSRKVTTVRSCWQPNVPATWIVA